MDFNYGMFMAEQEGLLKTRAGKINSIIRQMKAYPDKTIPKAVFIAIVEMNGIDPNSLTTKEMNKING